jgi:predicted nucleotidyltransferase
MKLYYNVDKYPLSFTENLPMQMEQKLNIECLFGSLCGMSVWGIANKVSDYDVYFFCSESNNNSNEIERSYGDWLASILIDYYAYDYDYLQDKIGLHLQMIEKLPSYASKTRIPVKHDRYVGILFNAIASDCIWDTGFLVDNVHQILHELPFWGLIDYYYSRVAGNLENVLQQNRVRVQKILTTIQSLNIMKWLLEKKTVAPADFEVLSKRFLYSDIYEMIHKYKNMHQNLVVDLKQLPELHFGSLNTMEMIRYGEGCYSGSYNDKKPLVYAERNTDLIRYVTLELAALKERIEDEGSTSATLELGSDCFLSQVINDQKTLSGRGVGVSKGIE